MNMRWRKVRGDLRAHGRQFVAILLVLIAGMSVVVAALNARAVLEREIATSYAAAESPDLALWFDRMTPELLNLVAGQEGVRAAEARRGATTRIAAKDGTWLLLRLTVISDFAAQRLGKVHLHAGTWPPAGDVVLLEQSAATLIDTTMGKALGIRTPTGETAAVPFGGFVHDPAIAPSTQERMIYAYVTPATAAQLGQSADLDQLLVKMDYRGTSADAADLAARLQAVLGKAGTPATRTDVLPNSHPHALLMNAMLRVLGVLSVMMIACSIAVSGYMVSGWMRREVRQVGIMKTLGAGTMQIARQYLALLAPLVLLAAAVALPLGFALGLALIDYYQVSLNIDIANRGITSSLLWQEVLVAVCVPLLAVAIPVVRAARMTAHAAVHDTGIVALPAGSRLAAYLIRLPGRVRWALAMRNSWRRPWRLMVMLLGLTAGGALLLLTHSNYESLMRVIDRSLADQGHDIEVQLQRPATAQAIEAVARATPGVVAAEAWRRAGVTLATAASAASASAQMRRIALTGFPEDSRLFHLPVVQGRKPARDSTMEIVVTRALQDAIPALQSGAQTTLQFRDRQSPVRIVGVVEEISAPVMYANFSTIDALTGQGDASTVLRVKVAGVAGVPGDQIELVANALDRAFLAARMAPAQVFTRNMLRDSLDEHFRVVGDVIRMVALAAALIGAIMLAATTALNVMERDREIGILRTLGASPRHIASLFWMEAASVTLLGLLLAIAVSIPLTLAMLHAAETRLLHVAVPMRFSLQGLVILLGGALVVLFTILATVRRSLRQSVRESLAYE